jgi:hypothetical protein
MKNETRSRTTKTEATKVAERACRAEFIFDIGRGGDIGRGAGLRRGGTSRPIQVLSDCMCDFSRADWDRRWSDWEARRNPYLNLFLCAEHARELGLMK